MKLERITGQPLQDLINQIEVDNRIAQMQDLMCKNFFAGITTTPVNDELIEKLDAIEEGVNFVMGKYTKSTYKPSNAIQAKEERKQAIRLKMKTRGKKS